MGLKANIRPDLAEKIPEFMPAVGAKSKTEYINKAVAEFNQRVWEEGELEKMRKRFAKNSKDDKEILRDFAAVRRIRD